MKKTNVVIASVLKPVDDTRMFEKFALTLAQQKEYSIHIIGFKSNSDYSVSNQNISFYPLFNFPRLSFKRFISPWKYYKKLLDIKPQVTVVTCIDLLIVTVCYKILFGTKILYDVQENNMANSIYTEKFRLPLNYILGYLMRLLEHICTPFITHYILAEKIYEKELSFIGKRYTIIENKYRPIEKYFQFQNRVPKKRSVYHLLYSGTISASYGIFEAIDLVKALYKLDNRFHLTIIGFCADQKVFTNVLRAVYSCPFIHIIGGNTLVPHADIIQAIQHADIGLIAYRYNESTVMRIPTKLYEYIYYKLPMLIPDNLLWKELCTIYNASIHIDYLCFNPEIILQQLIIHSFYGISNDDNQILFYEESIILNKLFSNI